jgi:hypothetical protein
MQKVTSYRNFLGFSLILIVVVFLGYAVFVSWILRDGLGPDAIDSNGLVAFQRFFKSFGPMLLIVSPIGVTGLWLTSPILRRNSRERRPRK